METAAVSAPITYLDRKVGGWCTYGQCPEMAEDGRQLCTRHRIRDAKARKQRRHKQRQARRGAGFCAECGLVPSETYRCLGCKAKFDSPTTKRHGSGPMAERDARIAARTSIDAEPDSAVGQANRLRYHGQPRAGRQSNAQLDEQDMLSARASVDKGIAGLRLARSEEYADRPRWERADAERAAFSHFDHAERQLDEIKERNHYSANVTSMVPRSTAENRRRR